MDELQEQEIRMTINQDHLTVDNEESKNFID